MRLNWTATLIQRSIDTHRQVLTLIFLIAYLELLPTAPGVAILNWKEEDGSTAPRGVIGQHPFKTALCEP